VLVGQARDGGEQLNLNAFFAQHLDQALVLMNHVLGLWPGETIAIVKPLGGVDGLDYLKKSGGTHYHLMQPACLGMASSASGSMDLEVNRHRGLLLPLMDIGDRKT
jgi:hypothetical protein